MQLNIASTWRQLCWYHKCHHNGHFVMQIGRNDQPMKLAIYRDAIVEASTWTTAIFALLLLLLSHLGRNSITEKSKNQTQSHHGKKWRSIADVNRPGRLHFNSIHRFTSIVLLAPMLNLNWISFNHWKSKWFQRQKLNWNEIQLSSEQIGWTSAFPIGRLRTTRVSFSCVGYLFSFD